LNGDLLTNIDVQALVKYHKEQNALVTIATHKRKVKIDLGVLEFDENSVITNYLEKPETTYHVSMGIYVYEPRVLSYIPKGAYLDFPNLVMKLIEAKEKVVSYVTDCLPLDVEEMVDRGHVEQHRELLLVAQELARFAPVLAVDVHDRLPVGEMEDRGVEPLEQRGRDVVVGHFPGRSTGVGGGLVLIFTRFVVGHQSARSGRATRTGLRGPPKRQHRVRSHGSGAGR
jgi:hypothetical protein